jgi:hypothetical protein
MLASPTAKSDCRAGEGTVEFAYCLGLRQGRAFLPMHFEKNVLKEMKQTNWRAAYGA